MVIVTLAVLIVLAVMFIRIIITLNDSIDIDIVENHQYSYN